MNANSLLSLTKHCLHLCNTHNFEETLIFHALESNILITNNVAQWQKSFEEKGMPVEIKKPEELKDWKGKKVVVDSSSLVDDFMKWEWRCKKLTHVVCVYNLDKIEPVILDKLVAAHDKMVLSVNNIRMLSNKDLEEKFENVSPELMESVVKKELKNVVLALLITNPMCGSDLVKVLYEKFKVFVSPGKLYPILHELEKKGLLVYESKLKNKIYRVNKKGEAEVVLKEQAEANLLITRLWAGD